MQNLSISIEWFTLTKVALAGLLTFITINILQPVLFIIRDRMLWWYIDKFVLNRTLRMVIDKAINLHSLLKYKYIYDTEMDATSAARLYYINNIPVSKDEYTDYEETRNNIEIRYFKSKAFIESRKEHFDRIEKYFKQDKTTFIDDIIEEIESRYKNNREPIKPYEIKGFT